MTSGLAPSTKAKTDKCDCVKNTFVHQKTQLNDNLKNGREYLLIIYLIKGYYPEYIKNSYKSIMKTR